MSILARRGLSAPKLCKTKNAASAPELPPFGAVGQGMSPTRTGTATSSSISLPDAIVRGASVSSDCDAIDAIGRTHSNSSSAGGQAMGRTTSMASLSGLAFGRTTSTGSQVGQDPASKRSGGGFLFSRKSTDSSPKKESRMKRILRFSMEDNTEHCITPYGKKYGKHPNDFTWNREGDMVEPRSPQSEEKGKRPSISGADTPKEQNGSRFKLMAKKMSTGNVGSELPPL